MNWHGKLNLVQSIALDKDNELTEMVFAIDNKTEGTPSKAVPSFLLVKRHFRNKKLDQLILNNNTAAIKLSWLA